MNPVTHYLTGWVLASANKKLSFKDKTLITISAIVPDIDGAGVIVDSLYSNYSQSPLLYETYHHTLCHNLVFAVVFSVFVFFRASQKIVTALVAFLAFHLHLLGDIIGSKGPDGDHWPIPYLMPFNKEVMITWDGQWPLTSWQNTVITIVLMVFCFYFARRDGNSVVGMFSKKGDTIFVETIRNRFGRGRENEFTK